MFYLITKSTVQTARYGTLEAVAVAMKLDPHEVEWAIEEHGRCDSENFVCIPVEPIND